MSNYFTEVTRDTFLISFKSKVDDNKFFKYVEKNFQKWGMVDIDYDKKEKTIIGKTPTISVTFWSKFPVRNGSLVRVQQGSPLTNKINLNIQCVKTFFLKC